MHEISFCMKQPVRYVAIIEQGLESFGVFFPDFPGCVSVGDTVAEVTQNAKEALHGHVALIVQDGDAIPAPTPMKEIPNDPEIIETARILIPVMIAG